MRGSDPDAAVYYLAAMLEGGEDARFVARRMVDPRLRGHRQRRPAGARSSRSPRRRRSSTSACPRRASTSHRRRSTSPARRSRTRATIALGEATEDVREHGTVAAAGLAPRRALRGGEEARPGSGLRLPARRPGRLRRRLPPRRAEGAHVLPPVRDGEEAGDAARIRVGRARRHSRRLPARRHLLRRALRLGSPRGSPTDHVVAPDLLGHGRSDWEPPVGAWKPTSAAMLETRAARARSGSATASAAASSPSWPPASPERVERLVLLDPALQVLPHVALDMAELERADVSYATVEDAVQARYDAGRVLLAPRELVIESDRGHLEPGPDGRLRYRYCKSAVIAAWSIMATPPPPPAPRADADRPRRRLLADPRRAGRGVPRRARRPARGSSPSPAATPSTGTRSTRRARRSPASCARGSSRRARS